jgi:hypothetical protein
VKGLPPMYQRRRQGPAERLESVLDSVPPGCWWTVVAFNIIREQGVHMSTVSLF